MIADYTDYAENYRQKNRDCSMTTEIFFKHIFSFLLYSGKQCFPGGFAHKPPEFSALRQRHIIDITAALLRGAGQRFRAT